MGRVFALDGPERTNHMKVKRVFGRWYNAGFTLTEVMIVVAVIALLAVIAVPNHLRARKRSQASRVLDDLRVIDNALDIYTLENRKTGNEPITLTGLVELQRYVKRDTPLYTSLPFDLLGNSFSVTDLKSPPKISRATFEALSDVAPSEFWSPYYP